MLQEPFASGNSFVHHLDPRTRLLSACAFSIVVAVSSSFQVLMAALLIALLLVIFAKLPAREIIKRIVVVNSFTLLLWLVVPLTFQGPTVFTLGPFTVYSPGVMLASQITLKSNAILLVLLALIATMPLAVLGSALHWFRVPDKIVHLLLMTYRYVFVLEQEYKRMIRAAQIRGFRPGTNLHTYKTYAYIIGMLFVRSALRADRVHQAMLCRGFKGKFYCLYRFSSGRQEWVFASFMGGVILLFIYLEWLKNWLFP